MGAFICSRALGRLYNSRLYRRRSAHALCTRRAISTPRSPSLLMVRLLKTSFARLSVYLASYSDTHLNVTSPMPFARKHVISVSDFETAIPNTAQTVTMTDITFSRLLGDRETVLASSAYNIPHSVCRPSFPPSLWTSDCPCFYRFCFSWLSSTVSSTMSASALTCLTSTSSKAVKILLVCCLHIVVFLFLPCDIQQGTQGQYY